jgi:large subunit ribosomal protein L14
MVYLNTKLIISDNSGGKLGECIKVLKSKYGCAYLSSLVVLVIKKASTNPDKKVKLHDIRIGVIIRMAKITRRFNDITIKFEDNAAILIDKRDNPLGSRIFGPVANELVLKKYNKIVFMASSII